MTGNGWWHALFAATMAVLVAIALVGVTGTRSDDWQALVAIGVLVAAYATFGRRGFRSQPAGIALIAVVVVCAGAAVRVDPSMALIQCIAMPLIWCQLTRTRDAVIGNVVLVAVIAAAMAIFLGPSASTIAQVALIEGISLVGSVALGLWISRIADLSTERARLLDELRLAQAEVEALGRAAGSASERERWAREVHDTIAQSLTGLVMLGQRARRELATGAPLAETLETLEATAREALVETRSLVAASAPVDLDGGLGAALHRLARRFERETGVAVRVLLDDDLAIGDPGADRGAEVVLLRCAQEGLANVRKHSGASAADVGVRRVGAEVVLTVHDDGCGFDATALSDGFGLAGMRERIALVRGRLEVRSAPGRGSTLVVGLPVGLAPALAAPEGASAASAAAAAAGAARAAGAEAAGTAGSAGAAADADADADADTADADTADADADTADAAAVAGAAEVGGAVGASAGAGLTGTPAAPGRGLGARA